MAVTLLALALAASCGRGPVVPDCAHPAITSVQQQPARPCAKEPR
jgi:hypothetical protein